MIIPMNFVIGAAAGAVTTYVLKDDTAKKWVKDAGSKIKSGAGSVTGVFKKKENIVKTTTADATSGGDVVEGKAKDVTDKTTTTA
jgi:hypothetical protein